MILIPTPDGHVPAFDQRGWHQARVPEALVIPDLNGDYLQLVAQSDGSVIVEVVSQDAILNKTRRSVLHYSPAQIKVLRAALFGPSA